MVTSTDQRSTIEEHEPSDEISYQTRVNINKIRTDGQKKQYSNLKKQTKRTQPTHTTCESYKLNSHNIFQQIPCQITLIVPV